MNYVRNFRQLVALPDKDAKIPRTVNKSIRRLASIFLLISMLGFMPSLPAENFLEPLAEMDTAANLFDSLDLVTTDWAVLLSERQSKPLMLQ
ncbi:MAG: hypothetical protein WCQ61_08890 [Proteiniphilum sp.]